jgi:hypothetical protein
MWLLLILTVLLLSLYWTKQYVQKLVAGVVLLAGGSAQLAIRFYSLLLLPGIIIHEMSHFLMAALLGVRTGDIALFPHAIEKDSDRVALGSVKVAKTDFVRASLIGAAPLFTGLTLLYVTIAMYLNLRIVFLDASIWNVITSQVTSQPWFLTLATIYLLWALSNTLFASKEDTRAWPGLMIFLTVLWITFLMLGGNVSWWSEALGAIENVFSHIVSGLLVGVIINMSACVFLLGLVFLLERATHKRLSYR